MCQVHYLWETERDFLFIIVMSPRVETQWRLYGERRGKREALFSRSWFWSVVITNSNKAEMAGRG